MPNLPIKQPLPISLGLYDESITAYYQPIIALDSGRITGYEVLGRAVGAASVRSLGPFFGDSSIPAEEHLAVDRIIRERAIERVGQEKDPPLLFLNLKPGWIYRIGESGELYTLSLLKKFGVDPRRVVIEITEESFGGSMEVLRAVVERYREQGCLIAIDDVGSGFSSADRIAQIQPNLLKIDVHMVKKSATHNGYFGVLRSFSDLAEQIGASLLFEGVETREDLERAIGSGARYVQGFFFAGAEPDFMESSRFADVIDSELSRHRKQYAASEKLWHSQAELLAERILHSAGPLGARDDADAWIERLLPGLHESCLRVYLCNEEGIQLTANYIREGENEWRREERFRHANWSWRPYFVPNVVQLGERRRSIVSKSYADLDTREWVRTILILARPGHILFADIRDAGTRASSS
ncbi:EAL domain-containing protein [Paenibacillus soyae]|uniref:EAL domain-containing protein n=1 Tax=Paenibacillus soyae TaxID=2969249 RepID=A0A9X2MXV1_9BACL|nr:EAL domain-containing protein [Paenibacillus soyae]MCR2807841.1 EAL domain-containing protein [Paenibacillus soyae]